jgi:purine-binding chemotaxis protein CheW
MPIMFDRDLPASGLAEDMLTRNQERTLQLITFSIGEEYAVPISQVREIVRVSGITMVPNSPSYMEGVINLRGRVLSVLNLRKRLRISAGRLSKMSRIVVTEVGDRVIGLLVDSVSHVIQVPSASIEPVPDEAMDVDSDYIAGVGKLKGTLVILLDIEKLLRREKADPGDAGSVTAAEL